MRPPSVTGQGTLPALGTPDTLQRAPRPSSPQRWKTTRQFPGKEHTKYDSLRRICGSLFITKVKKDGGRTDPCHLWEQTHCTQGHPGGNGCTTADPAWSGPVSQVAGCPGLLKPLPYGTSKKINAQDAEGPRGPPTSEDPHSSDPSQIQCPAAVAAPRAAWRSGEGA